MDFDLYALVEWTDSYVVASETCAFDLINAEYVREIEPGKLFRIEENSLESQMPLPKEENGPLCLRTYLFQSAG